LGGGGGDNCIKGTNTAGMKGSTSKVIYGIGYYIINTINTKYTLEGDFICAYILQKLTFGPLFDPLQIFKFIKLNFHKSHRLCSMCSSFPNIMLLLLFVDKNMKCWSNMGILHSSTTSKETSGDTWTFFMFSLVKAKVQYLNRFEHQPPKTFSQFPGNKYLYLALTIKLD
jgi:hypothetical protein